jgi:hypothetical protein
MSDFLGNLIAKSTGNASAIRPYLPSRFEVVTPNEAQLEVLDEMTFERATETPPQVRTVASVAEPRIERFAPPPLTDNRNAEANLSEPRYLTSDRNPAAEGPTPTTPRESKPALRDPDAVVRERLVERAVFVDRETRRPVESPSEPLHIRVERGLSASTLLIAAQPPAHVQGDAATAVYSVSSPEPTSPLVPADVARGPVNRQSPATRNKAEQFPATRIGAGRRGTIPPRALASQRSSEPDIHVTIGRVEVRATPPPATPPARRNAPQPMTLEEYLRGRTSGEQR